MNKRYSESQKEKAKELYDLGYKTAEIAEKTGVSVATLKSWKRGWKGTDIKNAKLEDAVSENAKMMHAINTKGLKIIHESLQKMKHLETVKELQQVADILNDLNKFNNSKKEDDVVVEDDDFEDPFGE